MSLDLQKLAEIVLGALDGCSEKDKGAALDLYRPHVLNGRHAEAVAALSVQFPAAAKALAAELGIETAPLPAAPPAPTEADLQAL